MPWRWTTQGAGPPPPRRATSSAGSIASAAQYSARAFTQERGERPAAKGVTHLPAVTPQRGIQLCNLFCSSKYVYFAIAAVRQGPGTWYAPTAETPPCVKALTGPAQGLRAWTSRCRGVPQADAMSWGGSACDGRRNDFAQQDLRCKMCRGLQHELLDPPVDLSPRIPLCQLPQSQCSAPPRITRNSTLMSRARTQAGRGSHVSSPQCIAHQVHGLGDDVRVAGHEAWVHRADEGLRERPRYEYCQHVAAPAAGSRGEAHDKAPVQIRTQSQWTTLSNVSRPIAT